jgi:hypothetical protein
MITRMALLAIVLLLLTATSTFTLSQELSEYDARRKAAWDAFDIEGCEKQGGTAKETGIFRLPLCVLPYPDANESCENATQCEGMCLPTGAQDPNTGKYPGQCQSTNELRGCTAYLGETGGLGEICVD